VNYLSEDASSEALECAPKSEYKEHDHRDSREVREGVFELSQKLGGNGIGDFCIHNQYFLSIFNFGNYMIL
jgi:hypothetical protein